MTDKTEWVIRIDSCGTGNNRILIRQPSFLADWRKTWDAMWYGRLGSATYVYKIKRNAERRLAELQKAEIQGEVVENPSKNLTNWRRA